MSAFALHDTDNNTNNDTNTNESAPDLLDINDLMVQELLAMDEDDHSAGDQGQGHGIKQSSTAPALGAIAQLETNTGGVAKKKVRPGNSAIQRRYRERKKEHVRELEETVDSLTLRIKELEAQNDSLVRNGTTGGGSGGTSTATDATKIMSEDEHSAGKEEEEKGNLMATVNHEFEVRVDRLKELLSNDAGEDELAEALAAVREACHKVSQAFPDSGIMLDARLPHMEACLQHGVLDADSWRSVVFNAQLDDTAVERILNWRRNYLEEIGEVFNQREIALASLHGSRRQSLCELVRGQARELAAVDQLRAGLLEQKRITTRYITSFFGSAVGGPRIAARIITAAYPRHVDPLALANFLYKRNETS